jgi:hypothetical protein
MSQDVFDPTIHKVVAVVAQDGHPERGTHVHVSLEELARDAREMPVQTVFHHEAPPPSIDLQPILDALDHLAGRVAAVEQAPASERQTQSDGVAVSEAFDPEPLVMHIAALQDRHAALAKQVMAIETYLQEILQHVEDHAQKLAAHRQELDVIETFPAFETEGAKRKAG